MLLVVGEAWGEHEENAGRAFVGPSGRLLKGLMSQYGLSPRDAYFTNVFNFRPPSNQIKSLYGTKAEAIPGFRAIAKSRYIRNEFAPELKRLHDEIRRIDPVLILALGNTALWGVCKKVGIKKYRGAPLYSNLGSGKEYKVIPTWHPAAILRQYNLKPILCADLEKTKRQSYFPEIRRPKRIIWLEPTLEDIKDFYHEHLVGQPFLSCDIETKERQITEVGFSTACGQYAIVIPFFSRSASDGNYWRSLSDELSAWNWVRKICWEFPLIGQNFQYDMTYFLRTVGIPCRFLGDTMLLHHSMYPEMEKGLGFLGSVYTDEPSWKFMRTDHSTIKQGDD